jgi:xylulokinase
VACGEYESVEAAAKAIVKVRETIVPQREIAEAYAKKYEMFRSLYPAIKGKL